MRKVVLAGNPNTGKSLLFMRITRIGILTANYSGTTVERKIGRFKYRDSEYELIDSPGVYSLDSYSQTDRIALKLIDEADIVVNVVDATSLERNLNLTLQLIQKRKPTVVCVNFWDETTHRGITIDIAKLETLLGVPVVAVSALRFEGIPGLLDAIGRARPGDMDFGEGDRWSAIGRILSGVQTLRHRHHTLLERVDEFTLHPAGGILTALVVLLGTLFAVRLLGEWLIGAVFSPLYDLYSPFVRGLVSKMPWEFVRALLAGTTVDPLASFGILTSGVYIALVMVFPYFFTFYLIFGFLEDLGYLPRLAVVLDRLFHRLGLQGYSSIPVMLGLGCKVPAFMATRSLTNRREKILTISLVFMSTPCLSQSAMIVSLGMHYGIAPILAIYAVLAALALAMNAALRKIFRRESAPELFTEFPSYRVPSVKLMAGKLWLRTSEYFAEVLPMIAVGVLAMSALESLHVLDFLIKLLRAPAQALFGLPADIAPVLFLNFLRKDASVALLAPLGLSAIQFMVACVLLALSMPCIAAFFTMIREMGIKTAFAVAGLNLLVAVCAAAAIHFILNGLEMIRLI
jgi:ferrous iron transport protein B